MELDPEDVEFDPEEARLIDCSCDICIDELEERVRSGQASEVAVEWVEAVRVVRGAS